MLEEINQNSNNIEYWKKEYLELSKDNEELLKYKNAWEYMFEWFNKKNAKRDTPKSLEIENFIIELMQEIEKMNGIEVE